MTPGARSKFGVPVFEPEVFRKQMYCTEESTCDIVGIFAPPAVIRHSGNCVPFSHRYAPAVQSVILEEICMIPAAQRGYMTSGARTKFGAPICESEVFWKEIYCIEESICGIVGNFRRPLQSFGAPTVISVPGEFAR